MTRYVHQEWPRWMVGPNGEKRIFPTQESVPVGWRTKDEAAKGEGGITFTPPVSSAPVADGHQETPKQRAARKAREARAAKKAARA